MSRDLAANLVLETAIAGHPHKHFWVRCPTNPQVSLCLLCWEKERWVDEETHSGLDIVCAMLSLAAQEKKAT